MEIEDDYRRRAEQMGVEVDELMRKEGWGEDASSPTELEAVLEQEREHTARRAVRATHAGLRLPEDDHRRASVLAEEPRLRHLAELAERRDVADAKLRRAVCFYREFDQDRLSLPKIALAIRSGPSAVRTMYTEGTREQVAQLLDEEAISPRDVGAPQWRPDDASRDGYYYLGTELGTGEPVVVPFGPIAVAARGDHCDRAMDLLSTQTAYAIAPNIVTNSESARQDLEAVCRYAVRTDDVARRDYGNSGYAATFFRMQIYPARFGTLWGAVTDTFLGDDGRRRPLADYIATTMPDGREVHPNDSELNCGAEDYGRVQYVVRMARNAGMPGKWNPDAAPRVVRIERSAEDSPPPERMVLVGEVHNRVKEWSKRIPVVIAPRRQADIRWKLCRQGERDIEFRLATADYSWIPSRERSVQA